MIGSLRKFNCSTEQWKNANSHIGCTDRVSWADIQTGVYKFATNLISFPNLHFSTWFYSPHSLPILFSFPSLFPSIHLCLPFPFPSPSVPFLPFSFPSLLPLSIFFPNSLIIFPPGVVWRKASLYTPAIKRYNTKVS